MITIRIRALRGETSFERIFSTNSAFSLPPTNALLGSEGGAMDERRKEQDEEQLREELHERDVEGVEEFPPEEQEAVVEAAEENPDPTTRREAIEQELMELGRSDAGSELGE